MKNAILQVPKPANEPVREYAPGSAEKKELKAQLTAMLAEEVEIPIVIGGEAVTTGKMAKCVCPHDHGHVLGQYHVGGTEQVHQAADAAAQAYPDWSGLPWDARLAVFRKAADLLATKYRPILNAATMLGQSKTAHQAEIDSACELIDFYRFNTYYACKVFAEQPDSGWGMWNYIDHRPLEGFVFAVTPFNFTAIAGNLPTAPAMMGNTVIWKPASSAVYSAHFLMKLFEEAGLPPGVINMVPGPGGAIGNPAMEHPSLAGVHFTGSTPVFHRMWQTIGTHIAKYKSYPRIVGETGGKDFIFAHASADHAALIAGAVRGAYEYQGQKCSAASRMYVPASTWKAIKDQLLDEIRSIKMGSVTDFRNFMAAVIDKNAYADIKGYVDYAKSSTDCDVLIGGECDDTKGYFISPTVVQAHKPDFKLMEEEIFGPVLTVYVYPDDAFEETLALCDQTSPYALTGGIFATDRKAIVTAMDRLRQAAGNFYINDKPTGAVVNQQPFGGARASGTNDKAGSVLNLVRWVSPRTVKESFVPPTDYRYPFLDEE
ncbi:MAG: L-glutamate gamma-semialdehyde dehydrogenase [Deltaproteobacteria bacterium]|jgi:1-pyrroline-5-carboxylate dehydrogenase|nr:L-glutamate gamma-semialdehyde dehydrogenase [Deltaproteobacteria bacterium]MBW2537938.1 L-glutamate gamma-semialdehyde dehydrogenase [Deltaproteobacteria bacterium]